MKRGRRPRQPGDLPTQAEVARRLGVSVRSVVAWEHSAVFKIQRSGKYGALLACVRAMAIGERDALQPGSLECLIAKGDYQL